MQKYKEFSPTQFDSKGLLGEYHGIADYLVIPVMHTRDSRPLDESNFATALDMLGGEDGEDVQVHRFGHWGPGWFEIVLINPLRDDLVKVGEEIEASLADYPALNDEDFSNREWEQVMMYWEQMGLREKYEYCRRAGESIFAARANDFSDFSERAPKAAERIEESGRE